jgi:hypothetical protein
MKAIFTALIGNYDKIFDPFHVQEGYDYHLFTDQNIESKIWQIHKVEGSPKLARRIKILAHEYLKDYDFTVWHDASIRQIANISDLTCMFKDFKIMKHPDRDCAYREADAVLKLGKDKPLIVNTQMEHYRKQGFPKWVGLVATGVIMRRNTPSVQKLCRLWWEEVERWSIRDQLSFNYALFKLGYEDMKSIDLMPFRILKTHFMHFKHLK